MDHQRSHAITPLLAMLVCHRLRVLLLTALAWLAACVAPPSTPDVSVPELVASTRQAYDELGKVYELAGESICINDDICRFADVDGDHDADLIMLRLNGNTREVWIATWNGFNLDPIAQRPGFVCAQDEMCDVGDFDGDGLADIIAIDPWADAYVSISTPTGFNPRTLWASKQIFCVLDCQILDVNNDKRADVVWSGTSAGKTGVFVVQSTGRWFTATFTTPNICPQGMTCLAGDVNGDHIADIVALHRGLDQGASVYYGDTAGDFFTLAYEASADLCHDGEVCLLSDINADGFADVVAFAHTTAQSPVWVALGSKNSISSRSLWDESLCVAGESCIVTNLQFPQAADVIVLTHRADSVYFAAPSQDSRILYHGGEVMVGATTVDVIVYGDLASSTESVLTDLVGHLGGTPYWNILSTYTNAGGVHVPNALTLGTVLHVDYTRGKVLSLDSDVPGIMIDSLKTLGNDSNGIYLILTAPDVNVLGTCAATLFGLHNAAYGPIAGPSRTERLARWAWVGSKTQCSTWQPPNGPNTPDADTMAFWVAHELAETLTDPTGEGWYVGEDGEVADLCQSTSTTVVYQAPNGAWANTRVGSHDFLLPDLWSNVPPPFSLAEGSCVISNP
jgi:hypothetical protein